MNAPPLSLADVILFIVLGVVGSAFAISTGIFRLPTIVTLATIIGWIAAVTCTLLYCTRLLLSLLRGNSEKFWEGLGVTNFGITALGVTLLFAPAPPAGSLLLFGVTMAIGGFFAFAVALFSEQLLGRVPTIIFHLAFVASPFLLKGTGLLIAATIAAVIISLVPAFLRMRRLA